jgi:hypothetical protein
MLVPGIHEYELGGFGDMRASGARAKSNYNRNCYEKDKVLIP